MKIVARQIKLKGTNIPYFLKRKRGVKYMRLSINRKGELIATLPFLFRISYLENFIKNKADWVLRKITQVKEEPPGILQKGNRTNYLNNKNRARRLILKKLEYFNKFYHFQYHRVSIRNQHSRWGSCSSMGNLNFNWRVVYLPQKYLDYLVVHELCHLKELNHSPKFWKLVAQEIPDYREIKKMMREL
ncbi:MAG: M48 family metallopeptidase [Patescibacteria group bacterium]|nr:M48 family metallopeptidase [Patescibacteria group bacterium]